MQRVTTITVGLTFVLAVALLGSLARAPAKKPQTSAVSSAKAEPAAVGPDPAPAAASGKITDSLVSSVPSAKGFDILPDGRKAPPLPDSAPQTVRFGVIIFRYQGAEFAPRDARSKEQARERAAASVTDAKRDFAAAAAKGDPGSTADAGRISRGILESAPEFVLFSLAKGEVSSEPVDTPVGFWVLRRND